MVGAVGLGLYGGRMLMEKFPPEGRSFSSESSSKLQSSQLFNRESVREVQVALHKLGYDEVGEIDGLYGEKTRNAILNFQADNSLDRDGCVTYRLLVSLRKQCELKGSLLIKK